MSNVAIQTIGGGATLPTTQKQYDIREVCQHLQRTVHSLCDFVHSQRATTIEVSTPYNFVNVNTTYAEIEKFSVEISTTAKAIKDKRFNSHIVSIAKYHDFTITVVGNMITINYSLNIPMLSYRAHLDMILRDRLTKFKKIISRRKKSWEGEEHSNKVQTEYPERFRKRVLHDLNHALKIERDLKLIRSVEWNYPLCNDDLYEPSITMHELLWQVLMDLDSGSHLLGPMVWSEKEFCFQVMQALSNGGEKDWSLVLRNTHCL